MNDRICKCKSSSGCLASSHCKHCSEGGIHQFTLQLPNCRINTASSLKNILNSINVNSWHSQGRDNEPCPHSCNVRRQLCRQCTSTQSNHIRRGTNKKTTLWMRSNLPEHLLLKRTPDLFYELAFLLSNFLFLLLLDILLTSISNAFT